MAKKIEKARPGTMKKVLGYIGKYKLLLPVSILLAVISVSLTLYIPTLIGEAIDLIAHINEPEVGSIDRITGVLIEAGLLIAVTAVAQWLMSTINNKISFGVVRDIRNDAFSKIETLPLSYVDRKAHGDVVSRVINDADQFAEGLLLGFTQLFTGVLTIIGTLAFMIYLNWVIAIVVFVLTPLSLFIARFIASRTYSMFKARSEYEGAATAYINEIVGNEKVVKAFSQEGKTLEKFANINAGLEKASLKAIFFSSLTNPTTRFVNSVVYAAVALVGALMAIPSVNSGAIVALVSVGELACLLSYANQYTKPFNEISGVLAEFQNSLACASRVFELIEEESEIPDKTDAVKLSGVEGNVSLKDVHFSYVPEKPLIEDLNLEVKPGMRVAIVGPTGCGKTTLINLLMRFYDVKEGSICVEGNDIRDVTRESLRESYGMVLQDTWLRAGTVRENIAMAKPEATDEEIIAAAKAAHAHSFIKRLKNGYDTVLGEGGEGLSQGQKQLLCITRIMLSLPPMLILDEATSSIDTRTEIRIQKAFLEMMEGRTSFIVAHRLSTIMGADLILVMKDGHIVESGNHKELLDKGGFYSTLYNSQFAH
ncbi:MAG: ABC transporter ATP-binding protein [Clostridia bacterium]|nr:ABC transporter ATP-binding protein [Clostridia bacterium]